MILRPSRNAADERTALAFPAGRPALIEQGLPVALRATLHELQIGITLLKEISDVH